jgi:hypothetical protein
MEGRIYFEKYGKTASDKFYINEDKRRAIENALKSGSKTQAVEIAKNYNKQVESKQQRMIEEAKLRAEQIKQLRDE